jgi:RHS repeat-associated protein
MTWNCTGGVTTSLTDENSQVTSNGYTTDPDFWRPNSMTDSASDVTTYSYTGATTVESSMPFNSGASTVDVVNTTDSLGRAQLSQRKQAPSSSTYDTIEISYDGDGRPYKTTLPYGGTAGQLNSTAPNKAAAFDALGRKTTMTDSGLMSATITYANNDAYQTLGPAPTGENTKRKQFEYDALGRLTSVCEVTSGTGSGSCAQTSPATGFWTTYTYDVLNNLVGVTQNAQATGSHQTRAYAYDDLSRMTSETNPESGTTTYTYDTDVTCGTTSKGDIIKKLDGVGNTTCFAYDALHRQTSITVISGSYSGTITPVKMFKYDSATVNSVVMTNVKGRLAEAYTCVSPCSSKITDLGLSYSNLGWASNLYEMTPHSSGYYHVSQGYYGNGAIASLGSLGGLPTMTYGVDGEGRIKTVSAGSGQNPLTGTTYNSASQPLTVTLGSLDNDAFTYDPNTDRATKYQFNVNGQSVIGQLTWNAIGTLESLVVTDPFFSGNNQTCAYTHEDLARLATANCGTPWSQTFTYDAFGNISKSGTMSFQPTYSYATNHMTMIGSSTPTYDLNGNVTNDFLHTYSWDATGKAVTIDSATVVYDALGRMVEQGKSGVFTEIVYTPAGSKFAIMSGTTFQKGFVSLPGGSMAVYNSSGLAYYRHSDWLGSSRFASTPTRTMYSDGAYGPFGEGYAQGGTIDPSFTGMNQDTTTNLYDFPAREFGTQGRWPSPDPAGKGSVTMSDPQSLNRYSYARNNPMGSVDPTGMKDINRANLLILAMGMGFGSGPAFGPDPFNFGPDPSNTSLQGMLASTETDNECGSCVYLDAAGTGFNSKEGSTGGGIDNNSTAGGCKATGGVFVDGSNVSVTVDQVSYDPSSDKIFIDSTQWDQGGGVNLGTIGIPGQASTTSTNYGDIIQMEKSGNFQIGWGSLGSALSQCALNAADFPPGTSTRWFVDTSKCVHDAFTDPNVGNNY